MTIAQQFNHNFENGDFLLFDSNGNKIYYETSDGYWEKRGFDSLDGNIIYFEDSDGFWAKREYDSNGNGIYYENSNGGVRYDNRPTPLATAKS